MKEKIKDVMKTVLETGEIPENISRDNFPKWDSLHHLALIIELESLFNVSFEPEEITKMKDLATIENIVESKLKR